MSRVLAFRARARAEERQPAPVPEVPITLRDRVFHVRALLVEALSDGYYFGLEEGKLNLERAREGADLADALATELFVILHSYEIPHREGGGTPESIPEPSQEFKSAKVCSHLDAEDGARVPEPAGRQAKVGDALAMRSPTPIDAAPGGELAAAGEFVPGGAA